MSLIPDTQNCGLCMRRECRERFPRHRGLAIPTCITARAWRTCHDACRDRLLAVSFEVGGVENVPGFPGACATSNVACLVRDPWQVRYPRGPGWNGVSSTQPRQNIAKRHQWAASIILAKTSFWCNSCVSQSVWRHGCFSSDVLPETIHAIARKYHMNIYIYSLFLLSSTTGFNYNFSLYLI